MKSVLSVCVTALMLWGCGGGDSGNSGSINMAGAGGMNAADAGSGAGGSGGSMAVADMGLGMGGTGGSLEADMGLGVPPDGVVSTLPEGDADEGEPQPYQTPASLSAAFPGDSPTPNRGCSATDVAAIRGWVADRIGRPIAGAKAQLCVVGDDGTTNCLRPSDTDENGVFVLNIGADFRCINKAAFRIIKPGAARAPMYCNADLSGVGADSRLTIEQPYVMYGTLRPADLPPVGDERAQRTVTFETGVELDVVPYDMVSAYTELGMREVKTDERGLCFIGDAPPTRLYAFSPDSTIYGTAQIRFPNPDGLAAGSQVEISILGGLGCEVNGMHIAEGAWAPIGTGTVAADGGKIVPDEGVALSCLTWIGYKPI